LAPIFVTAHPYRLDSAAAMAANKHAALLQLRQRFIREENFRLNHLQEGIDKILPDAASSEAQSWKAHVNALSDASYEINKEGKNVPWPDVRYI
jgi:hypothetical protein